MINIRSFQSSISKPLLWKLTGFGSSIVGFSCYALSPSFRYLFKEWTPLKIVAYSVVSSLLSISMLFVKRCSLGRHGKSLLLKAHVGFVVLALTTLWSFWEDRCEQGKVENRFGKMMNLTSTGAFALMAMSLSRQLQLGFDVGVTNFLVGCFLVTVMKMNLKLAPVAALFCYLLVNIRSISELRARRGTQHADDHTEEPSLKDVEANSDAFANDTVVGREIITKKELGESKGAVGFGEISVLVIKKYWNDIRSILSPKNIAKSKEVLFLKKCGCEVRKIFLRKKFKDDTDEANSQDLEANSGVFTHDTNEANFRDLEANSDVFERDKNEANFQDLEPNSDVCAHEHDTNEANFQDHEAKSDVSDHDKNEANIQDLEANSNVLARDIDEPNFQDHESKSDVSDHDKNEANIQDLEANSNVLARDIDQPNFQDHEANDVFAHDTTNEAKLQDHEENSNVLARDTEEPSFQDPEANSDVFARDTNESNFQDREANSDVCVHETDVATFQDREAYSDNVFEDDTVAGREIVIKNESGESKEADSLRSSEIPVRGPKKYGNDIQNILSPKNIGKSKEVRALKKFGNDVGNFFTPKRLHGKLN